MRHFIFYSIIAENGEGWGGVGVGETHARMQIG